MEDKEPKQRIYEDLGLEGAGVSYESFSKKFDSDPEARKSVYKDLGLEQAGVDYQTFETKMFGEKKNSIGSDASTGGKVGALETPSIGSSPFLQKAKERAEQGAPTVLSVKKETVKEVGLPSYTPTKEEELKAPTQKQFEQQALPPTYQKESALDISKKQTQVATERSKALDELIKTKKEAQSSYEKIRNLDKQIESFEPQFEKFKTTAEAFQPDIQEYKNLTSKIAEIKNKSNSFVLEYNNEYQKLAPKLEAYKQIFENEKLPNEKRQDAYENYNGVVSILKNKEKLLDQAVAQNEQGIGDLEAKAKSFDETIKKATANQAGFSQLYSQYKSLIDERNKSAEGLGVYEKRMSDAQNQIKQKLFEQSQLEDVRQQKLEKEYSTWQNLLESLPKMGIEAVAGVSDMLNVLGFSGDPESPETRDEVKKETRKNIEKLRKFGDSFITQELPKNYEKFFEGQFSLKKLANVGFNAIASTAPTIAAGLIGGPAAGVLAGAGMAFGESKEIMMEAGLTEEQAEAAAFGLSFPIGLLENYGAEDFVKLFSKEAVEYSTKIFLKNIAGRTLTKEQLFNEAKNTIGQIIKDGAPQLLKEGVKESGTEASQGTVNEVAKQVAQEFTGVDLDENMSWSDYLKNQAEVRGEEMVGGFIGGTSMQTIGLGLKSAGEGIFPTFNPSAYQKALELLDPSKMEAFSQEVQQEVQDKVLTQEQADLAFRNIQLIQETNKLIPATIDNKDLRTEALNLLIEKKETQKEIEGKDDALVAPQKARIEEINKRLSDIANGKEEEVVTPTVKLNKNTTPTEEKYGTIDRGDGKGVVDLTRAEYEAELAKQGGVEMEEASVFETDKTESRQPIDLSIEPTTAPAEGVKAGQEQVTEPLKDVESKAKALEGVAKEDVEIRNVVDRFEKKLNELGNTKEFEKWLIGEDGYGGFLAEGNNREVLNKIPEKWQEQMWEGDFAAVKKRYSKAVEQLLGKPKEAVSVSDKKADIENQVEKIQKALDNEEYGHSLTGNTGAYITGTALDIDFTKEELEKYNNLYKKYPEKIVNDEDVNWEERKKEKDKLIREILERGLKETKQELAALKGTQTQPAPTATVSQEDSVVKGDVGLNNERERLKTKLEKLEYKIPNSSGRIRLNKDGSFKEYGDYIDGVWNKDSDDINVGSIKSDYKKVKQLYDADIKLNDLINSKLSNDLVSLKEKLGGLKELKKAFQDFSFEQIGSTANLDMGIELFLKQALQFDKLEGVEKAVKEINAKYNKKLAALEGTQTQPKQVAPTTKEEKGKSGIPSKTDKAYQEAQGVTERVSKAHPEASVLVLPKGDDLSLTALYVGKEKRGKGIGSGVLESVKAEADKLGKKVVLDATNELDEETDLERLGEFYERNGFVKVGENKFEYTPKKNQLLTPNINQNETVNENVREIGNGQKDGQKGDVSQEAKSDVQEGEEKVAEGEEPTAEQVDKASKAVGTTPSNLRDLYRISRDLFGQNRVKAFASAIAMDRMIGAMAKRAGIPKQRMYEKLQFRKASEQELPQGVKFQIDAWHGSPYQFDKFTTEKIGTGEGAQAFGWGLYFTDLEGIARGYAEKLSDYQVIIDGKPSYESSFWRLETTLNYNPKAWVGMSKEDIANEIKKDTGIDKLTKQEILSELEKVKTIKIDTNRILYKTTLHKGKTPDQYTWLEWDESIPNNIDNKIYNSLSESQKKKFDSVVVNDEGQSIYEALSKTLGGYKQASLFLLENGVDGIKYPAESISRGATSDTARGFNYVVFDENAVSIEEVIKFQKDAEKARGAMMMALDGQAIIYALSDPNVSTPLHEMAHVFEHYLTESERQTIIRNAGTGAWTTETSEYFARGFEKYLAEGVAPTKELQKVFEKFKEWLTEIYNGITGSEIDIQLNDEMRAIYAQMFGEEEVNSKFKPNEKITQKEDGKPLPEGVSSVRTETEERKTSPELRPQEEEVRSIIDNAVANFYAINEATKRSEKREAAKEYRQNLEKMPTVKNIFDNIKTIFAQLEAEGIITKSKDCP